MQRVQQNLSATLTQTVTVGGTATDPVPDSATVTITRADGTVVVTDSPTVDGGVGVFTYTLSPADTALLDLLTVEWKFTLGGEEQTDTEYIEVVGGFLFSVADIRQFDPLQNTTLYTTAKITAARTMAEQVIEDACGVAFVPRYRYRTLSGVRGTMLSLWDSYVTSVRSASVNGTVYTETDLDALKIDGSFVTGTANWYPGPVTVGYEYGRPFPPAHISRAAMLLAKFYLVDSPIDDRFTSVSTEAGTFSLVTPGVRGAYTAIPEVNAAIDAERLPVVA